jgi:hypothetical protein
MSCRELERLFVADAAATEVAAHRRSCAECERLGQEIDKTVALYEGLRAPAWSPVLRRALLEIPRQTVSCEGAERLLAEAVEGEIAGADDRRLQGHLSRCPACTEAAAVLFSVRDLEAPAPPAWLATRLAASRPEVKRAGWRRLFSGKAVVAYAYALALVVMLLGWNPTAAARKAGFANLSVSTRNAVTVAQHSLSDRLGAVQEKAARTFAVWRGHVFGYGRAAVSNAIAIVWRPEPKKTPNRPRLGKEGGNATGTEGFVTAGIRGQELFPARFRV